MVRINAPAILLFILAAQLVHTQPAEKREFEVASFHSAGEADVRVPESVKQSREGGPGTSDPERMVFSRVPLDGIISYAFDLSTRQISAPDWTSTERYTIVAKIARGTDIAGSKEMLRNLLVERLGLAYHMQTRSLSGFEVRIAPGGPKLKRSESAGNDNAVRPVGISLTTNAEGFPILPPGDHSGEARSKGVFHLTFRDASLSELAERLGPRLGYDSKKIDLDAPGQFLYRTQPAPVVDKTGLEGRYDFTLVFPAGGIHAPSSVPDIMKRIQKALEAQLGLTLVTARVPESVLVIDRLQQVPTTD
jgi:uncharacterized protein (TIGR03435 family)